MRAVVIPRFGGPEVLEVRDLPAPAPGPGEVTIDVAYAGVNHAEVLYRRGDVDVPLPFTPGIEVAGHIRALGPDVTGLRAGQPVAALTTVDSGGYAEVVRVAAPLVFPLDTLAPDLGLAVAAAFPSNTTTALLVLSTVAHLQKGERVLIHGASGGVGSVLGQMAHALVLQRRLCKTAVFSGKSRPMARLCWPSAPIITAMRVSTSSTKAPLHSYWKNPSL